MAFLIYKKTTDGKTSRYEKIQPLKLSGRDGLIARHVKTLTDAEAPSWKLEVATMLKLAGFDASGTTVLFDGSGRDAKNVCLYELARIHGSSRDTSTQLALDLSVIIDQEITADAAGFARKFEVDWPTQPKVLAEMLALTGGFGGGDWKWSESGMNLGATVVQAQPTHSGCEPRARLPLMSRPGDVVQFRATANTPATVRIANGREAAAWKFEQFPPALKDWLNRETRRHGFNTAEELLAAPVAEWQSPLPLEKIADVDIEQARKLRDALRPWLIRQDDPGMSSADREAKGVLD